MKPLFSFLTFLRDNYLLVLGAVFLGVLFFYVGHFSEFIYAGIRLFTIVFVAAVVLHWKFPQTLHKYINEDKLIADFDSLEPKHRVYVAFGMFAVLFIVAAWSFCSP